jgi:hypothetical protein
MQNTEKVDRYGSDLIYSIDHIFVETHDIKNPVLKNETDQIRSLLRKKKISHVNLNWK